MAKIIHTQQELLDRFKTMDPPSNIDEFGPVKSIKQLRPFLLEFNNKHELPLTEQLADHTKARQISFNSILGKEKQPKMENVALNTPKIQNVVNFSPKKIGEVKQEPFVADFSEPARIETFQKIISSDPKLPPGFNATPVDKKQDKEMFKNTQTPKTASFDKIFENEMLSRPDQAGHFFNPTNVKTEENTQKAKIDIESEYNPKKAKKVIYAPSIDDIEIEQPKQEKEEVVEPSFNEIIEKEEKQEAKKSEENDFVVPDSNFAEEEPDFVPSFRPVQAKPKAVPTVDDQKKNKRNKNRFAPYIPEEAKKATKEEPAVDPSVPRFDDIVKMEAETEKKKNKRAKPNFTLEEEEEKKPVVIEEFQPRVAKPKKFAPTLEEAEEERKREAEEKRKEQQRKGYLSFSELEQNEKVQENKNKKQQQEQKAKSNAFDFNSLLSQAEQEEKARKKPKKYTYVPEQFPSPSSPMFTPTAATVVYSEPSYQEDDEPTFAPKSAKKDDYEEEVESREEKKKHNMERKKQKSEFELMLEEEQRRSAAKNKPVQKRYTIEEEQKEEPDVSFKPKQATKVYDGVSIDALNTKKQTQVDTVQKEETPEQEQPAAKEEPKQEKKQKGKKKKFVAYLSPELNSQLSQAKAAPAPTKSSAGPSFEELMAMEEKAKPKQQKKQRTQLFVEDDDMEDVSFNPQPRFAQRNKNVPQAKKSGFDFNALMEEETKAKAKEKPAQTPSYKAGNMSLHTPSFEDLMQKEQEREKRFEDGSLEVVGQPQPQEQPIFEEEENRRPSTRMPRSQRSRGQGRRKQATYKYDNEDLFWGAPADDGEVVDSSKFKENDFPSLASTAPSQKAKTIKQVNEANALMRERSHNRPIEYLAKQLVKAGLEEDEAEEIAESISTLGKFEMVDALRSLLPDTKKASPIVSSFFRAFPNGR